MMNVDGIMRALDEHQEELRRLGVRRLSLFGSAARNEATEASDLDFLVEFQQKSFDGYMDLKSLLEHLFGRPIDLVLPETLKPRLRDRYFNVDVEIVWDVVQNKLSDLKAAAIMMLADDDADETQ